MHMKNITCPKAIISNMHSVVLERSINHGLKISKFIVIMLIIIFNAEIASSTLSITNFQASSSTTLTFSLFDITTTVAANSILIITLPSQYSALTLFKNAPYS